MRLKQQGSSRSLNALFWILIIGGGFCVYIISGDLIGALQKRGGAGDASIFFALPIVVFVLFPVSIAYAINVLLRLKRHLYVERKHKITALLLFTILLISVAYSAFMINRAYEGTSPITVRH